MKSGKKFFIWLGYMHVKNGGGRASMKRREWPGWAQGAWDHGRYIAIYCTPQKARTYRAVNVKVVISEY